MSWRRWLGLILGSIVLLAAAAWLARAWLAGQAARAYFRAHGIHSEITVGALGLSGVTGSFALGPADAPVIAVRHMQVRFNPARWIPQVVSVRLDDPVVRARVDARGRVHLGALQAWLDSLGGGGGRSDYVSDDLTITLTGLRAFLDTPAGALQAGGDIALRKNLPVRLSLSLRPALLTYKGYRATLAAASLSYDGASGDTRIHVAGDLRAPSVAARGLVADLRAAGLRWRMQGGAIAVGTPRVELTARAAGLDAGAAWTNPSLDLALNDVGLQSGPAAVLKADGDVRLSAAADTALDAPATGDAALTAAIARNLRHMDISLQGHLHSQDGRTRMTMTAPLTVRGARGAELAVSALTLDGLPDAIRARFDARAGGGGLPRIALNGADLTWGGGGLEGRLGLAATFDYAMLRGARASGQVTLSWRDGAYAVALQGCAPVRLARFQPGKVMAQAVSATLCPAARDPLLSGRGGDWTMRALARKVEADLPLASARLDGGVAALAFHGGAPQGVVTVRAGRVSDGMRPVRFNPVTGSGRIALRRGVWRGTLALTDTRGHALADVALTHVMASGRGEARIAAPHLAFAPGALQPVDLSPLLAAFRQTQGQAGFDGEVRWDAQGLDSHGTLAIDGLNFLTPLGTAHAVKTKIAFTSLLPPRTAPGQDLSISRIDWTLPFSAVDLKFAFDTSAIRVDAIKADFAQGHASLGAFTIRTSDPTRIQGAADLNAITLSSVIAASNLGSRISLEGKVSGHIPFTTGPEGLRIQGGRLSADGPGRLSIARSLWTQNGPADNAVQDFAYQALEHLAFDDMTAQVNSIGGGRLQIVFHIKGYSDPPRAQIAEVPLTSLLDGSALRSSIPLPSGTPIDLTLDTSLNFDELLKSYAEAWSKTLSPAPARRTTP